MSACEYRLILSAAGGPKSLLNQSLFQLNSAIKFAPRIGGSIQDHMKKSAVKFYLKHVGCLFTILVELGNRETAKDLSRLAIDAIESNEIRECVAARLKIPKLDLKGV